MSSRRRALTVLGVSAGATACALLTSGVLGGGAGLVGGSVRLLPSAAADGLPAFDDCEQLRRWYVHEALPQVGPWGFGGRPLMALGRRSESGVPSPVPLAGQAAGQGTDTAVGSSGSGTNIQEAGVDESDVAKTDGRIVVRVVAGDLVVTDVSTGHAHELSRTPLPGPRLARPELLLHDDRVLVVGDELTTSPWQGVVPDRTFIPVRPPREGRAHLVSLDVSDPAAPRVTGDRYVDGGAVSTREYGDGTVRVVVTTGFPPLDFVQPDRGRTPRQATRENRQIVRSTPIGTWLPGIRSGDGARRPLLRCAEVRHPRQASGFGTISVLTFPFDGPAGFTATAVTAAGDLAYSSADRLYVATAVGGPGGIVPLDTPAGSSSAPALPTTQVHAFALDRGRTTYVASGSFPGQVQDRWSFSAYDGQLRVATRLPRRDGTADNGIVVLGERDGRLTETGRVDGLGRGEDIRSVRWLGDLAIMVTFRQTDPFYTVDLRDPRRPRLVGTLRIPGYSSYLHPVGQDRVIGIGQDVSPASGADLGAQAATFDLRRLGAVRRVDAYAFGPHTEVTAGLDPRAFTYLPEQRTLVTPVQDWMSGRSRFVALRLAPDGSLSPAGTWVTRHYAGPDVRALPLGEGRVALVGDVVRVVDVR